LVVGATTKSQGKLDLEVKPEVLPVGANVLWAYAQLPQALQGKAVPETVIGQYQV
jgi:hypothetical protein